MTRSLFAPLTTAALLLGSAATAQVTAADVWTNSNALFEALGATIFASPATDGATTTYGDYSASFGLPFNSGAVRFDLPAMALTENGDGSVSLSFPADYDFGFDGEIYGRGSFAATFDGSVGDVVITATGSPGDITYESAATTFSMVMTEALVDGAPIQGLTVSLTTDSTGGGTTMRITEGDLVTMTVDQVSDRATVAFDYALVGQADGQSRSTTTGTATTFEFAIPAAGTDIMNLAAALRSGMMLSGTNSAQSSETSTVARDSLGVIVSEQSTRQGPTQARFGLDADGLAFVASASGASLALREQMLPFPISAEIATVVAEWQIPLLASPEAQEFVFNTTLGGVTVADGLWGMIDPGQILDRSAITYQVDLSGDAIISTDLLDFNALMALGQTGDLPGEAPVIRLDTLVLEALGARVTADGEIALDYSMIPVMGSPMPTSGTLSFRAEGLNAAMQALTQAGLLTPQDTMPVTMGLGMIGRPVGNDAYEGTIELTPDGQILANGIPLQ